MTSTAGENFTKSNQKSYNNLANGYKYSMEQDSLSQDMHYKMSKKIAQLTKVICALNTKNDDHESTVEFLKSQHSKELRQLMEEMNNKVELLEGKVKSHLLENQKMNELQQTNKNYEKMLEESKRKLENYQNDNDYKSREADIKHAEQMQSMSDQVKSLRLSYEQLLDEFCNLAKTMEMEKNSEIQNMKVQYENEIRKIREDSDQKESQLQNLISGNQNESQILFAKAQKEIQIGINTRENMMKEYEKRIQDLQNLMQSMTSDFSDQKKTLEFEIEEQKAKCFSLEKKIHEKEGHLTKNVNQYTGELTEKEKLIGILEDKIKSHEIDSREKEKNYSQLSQEVEHLKVVVKKMETEVKSKTNESYKFKNKIEEQDQELAIKIKQIKELKFNNDGLQQRLLDKEKELKNTLHQINIMNEESKEMENCSKSVTIDYEIQIQTLKRGLEELNSERTSERAEIEKMKRLHEIELMECISRMKRDFETDVDRTNKKHEKEMSLREKEHQEEIHKYKDEQQTLVEEERTKASKIIQKLKNDLEQTKNEINSRLKTKEKEISALEESISGRDKEIKSLNIQLKDLKESHGTMKKENKKMTKHISDKDIEIENLLKNVEKIKASLEEQKLLNEKIRRNSQIQEDMSEKYNKLSAELDLKWADTLRRETGRLRNDLTETFAIEKQKAVEKIEKSKNSEIETMKNSYEAERSNLLEEISKHEAEVAKLCEEVTSLKTVNESQTTSKIHEIQSLLSETQSAHMKEMTDLKKSYEIKIENQIKLFEQEKVRYTSKMKTQLDETERDLDEKYKNIINDLNQESEKKMKIKLDELENRYNRQTDSKVHDIQSQMTEKMNLSEEGHCKEIKSMDLKISTLEEQIRSLETKHRIELERLTSSKLKLDLSSQKLEDQLHAIAKENQTLKKQIDEFGNDYSRNQKDFADKLRNQESELKRGFEQVTQNLKMKYEDESKQLLNDFNKAQNLYKEKIRDLNKRLLELEELYVNRPSRDEDLEVIQTLRAQLKVSEKEIEKLNEEKRFVQLELTNRETNFNKIFNASPNVGIINPTQGAIKTKKISNDKLKSFQKLTPLPGSPFHDDPLNPAKPLPPSSRKSIDNS